MIGVELRSTVRFVFNREDGSVKTHLHTSPIVVVKILTEHAVQRVVERDEIPYPYKVHDATLRPLLNIMDSASHNPALCATCCPL